MISKRDFLLAIMIGAICMLIFTGFMGIKFIFLEKWNLLFSTMVFVIPTILALISFKIFKSDSTPNPKKGYSY